MANPFINSSFTLRPSTNDRDKPELTLRLTEVSRIPKETAVTGNCSKGGRAFKRQRLFMDRSVSTTGFVFDCNDNDHYRNEDQYISEDEYNTTIIRRRVSSEFPSRNRISAGSSVSESNYWKSRCLGMQRICFESKTQLTDAEEDQRQLRRRIRELEEQLLLQTSESSNSSTICTDDGDATNDEALVDRDRVTHGNVEGKNNMGIADGKGDEDMHCNDMKKEALPALVVEIKENHQAVSSCFYLTDGEGLNESYDLDVEEDEDVSMNANFCDGILDDIDDDRNDINVNQQRG